MTLSKNLNPFRFYVYAYLRDKDSANAKAGTPYYIGKGTGTRSTYKGIGEVHPPLDKKLIIILEQNLSNVGALALERQYIKWYGRIDTGTGILRNKTEGGDAGPGFPNGQKKPPRTAAHSLNNSISNKGKHFGPRSSEYMAKVTEINKASGAKKKGTPWSDARRQAQIKRRENYDLA